MEAPHALPQASPLQAGPSQSPPEIQPMEERKLEATAGHQVVPAIPSSTKSLRFPLRPGKGSVGTSCLVKANHFFAELPDRDLHQYDVRPYISNLQPAFLSYLEESRVTSDLLWTGLNHTGSYITSS
jgi:hypothetical protein